MMMHGDGCGDDDDPLTWRSLALALVYLLFLAGCFLYDALAVPLLDGMEVLCTRLRIGRLASDLMDSTNVYHVLRLATLPWLGWRERGSVLLHGLSALPLTAWLGWTAIKCLKHLVSPYFSLRAAVLLPLLHLAGAYLANAAVAVARFVESRVAGTPVRRFLICGTPLTKYQWWSVYCVIAALLRQSSRRAPPCSFDGFYRQKYWPRGLCPWLLRRLTQCVALTTAVIVLTTQRDAWGGQLLPRRAGRDVPLGQSGADYDEGYDLSWCTAKNIRRFLPDVTHGKVVSVYDGDTLTLAGRHAGQGPPTLFSVRLAGVDTPEMTAATREEREAAVAARDALRSRVMARIVQVSVKRADKYGRLLADVSIGGEDMSQWLIASGHGRPYGGGRRLGWSFFARDTSGGGGEDQDDDDAF